MFIKQRFKEEGNCTKDTTVLRDQCSILPQVHEINFKIQAGREEQPSCSTSLLKKQLFLR